MGPGRGLALLLALALARRSPLVALALLVHQRVTSPVGPAGPAGDRWSSLPRWVVGLALARLLAPAAAVPLALVVSLVGVLAVVLVLAGGITVVAGVAGLG